MDEARPPPATPDFRALFESAPGHYLVLAPDLTILAASDAYLDATMTRRHDIVGRGLFEVFPDNPDDPDADGTRNLRASLDRVLEHRQRDTMPVQKYDIRRPASQGGSFEERYWSPSNSPVFGDDGEVRYIIHRVEDVTAKVHSERETVRTTRFLEAVLENIPHMVFVKDAERLSFVRFNRAGEELLGLPRGELLGKDDYDLFAEEAAAAFQAKDREALHNGRLVDVPEEPLSTPRGTRLLHTKKVPILDESGRPAYLLGISEDITERRAGEEARTRLAAIVESSDDAIISTTLDGVVTSWNRGAETLYGYSAEEMVGRSMSPLLPRDRVDEHARALALVEETGRTAPFETVRRHKDGSDIDVSLSFCPLLDAHGSTIGVSRIARDIRAQRRAAEALAEKNAALEVASRGDRIGARVMTALNRHHESKTRADEVLRVLAEEAGYRPLAFYEYEDWRGGLTRRATLGLPAAESELAVGEGLVGEAAARRQPVFLTASETASFSLDTGVGTLPAAAVFALPLLHRESLLGVVAGASRAPLTERERAWLTGLAGQLGVGFYAAHQFEELKRLSAQLNERSRRVEEQNRELARANRLKSEFLASMSHELRTPLNAIIGFSEALRDGLLGALAPEQAEYADDIYNSGRHLLSLINDILDLSKIEAGKMDLDVEPVDVASLIANALTIIKEQAFKGGVTLRHNVDDGISDIDADGRKLRQIVYNLLSNAVKFTPSGGTVRVDVTREGADLQIAVTDTGIGIAADELPRLFQAFVQLDGGVDRRYEGTGLGLVLVKRLVELHGGSVAVESEEGVGSRFAVRIPLRRPAPTDAPSTAPAAREPPQRSQPGGRRRILVVDDDPAAISLARRWLQQVDYATEGALTCEAAWEAIEARPPDAILLDILFENGPEGWEFLERLRESPRFARIPVIVVSIVADLGRGLALGAMEVLQKPVAGADLIAVVEALGIRPYGRDNALVVDDDPRSMDHVTRALEQEGIVVSRAYGGQDALDAVAERAFSVIVLDLVMPEVTGFDVVRALRSDPATADIPIVILTAKTLEPRERAMLVRDVHSLLSKGDWDQGDFVGVVQAAIAAGAPSLLLGATADDAQRGALPSVRRRLSGRVVAIASDPLVQGLLRLYLEDCGLEVALADSAESADAELRRARPDLVAIDMEVLASDGRPLVAARVRGGELDGVPVVVIAEERTPAGLDPAIVVGKPMRRAELLDLVERRLAAPTRGAP